MKFQGKVIRSFYCTQVLPTYECGMNKLQYFLKPIKSFAMMLERLEKLRLKTSNFQTVTIYWSCSSISTLIKHISWVSREEVRLRLDFALEFPQKVSSLTLVASNPSGFDYDDPEIENTYFARDEALSEKWDAEALADLDVEMWVDGPGQQLGRAAKDVRQKVHAMTLQHYRDYFAAFVEKGPKICASSLLLFNGLPISLYQRLSSAVILTLVMLLLPLLS